MKFFYNGIKDSSGRLFKATYSSGRLYRHPENTITIYAKDYKGFSAEIASHFDIEDNSDSQIDYFEKERIRVIPTHPLYNAVLEAFLKSEEHFKKRFYKAA